MSATFEDRCSLIRHHAHMIERGSLHAEVVEGHAGTISIGEIDLKKAIRDIEAALERLRTLDQQCQEKRDEFRNAA